MRVLLADEDEAFRTFVKRLLGSTVDLVGEASDAETAAWMARELAPDVVLMDVAMPPVGGVSASRLVKAAHPAAKVLILTAHKEEAYLSATGKAGGDAFLPKMNVRGELLSTIRSLAMPFGTRARLGRAL